MTRAQIVGLLVVAGGWFAYSHHRAPVDAAQRDEHVVRGDLTVSATFDATLEARHVAMVMSRVQGRATVIEQVPEGQAVAAGDMLVRLDDSEIRLDLVKQKHELARAEAALDSLEHGEIPLDVKDVDVQLADAAQQLDGEKKILEDTKILVDRNLVSAHELEQESGKLESLQARYAQLEQKRKLMEDFIHPAKLAAARSDVDAAKQQVEQLEQEVDECIIKAPCAGLVVYLPLHFGNEYRASRVGDTVYPNQPFVCLPDVKEFLAPCYVPESDLALVKPDGEAIITPVSYPDCKLKGRVESIGLMAQPQPGLPSWQKYFRVIFRVDDLDEKLRPGMSLRVESIARHAKDLTLIPRSAVQWEQGAPFAHVRKGRKVIVSPLKLGDGDERFFEVLAGASAGDQVILP